MFIRLFHLNTIRRRLSFVLIFTIISVAIAQAVYIYERFKRVEANAIKSNMEIAQSAAAIIKESIHAILYQELAIGINLSHVIDLSVERMNKILADNKAGHPFIRTFSWYDPKKNRVIAASSGIVGIDYSDREYIQEIVSGKEWAVSGVIVSRVPPLVPIFTVSRGIRDKSGNLSGIVIAGIETDKFHDTIKADQAFDRAITIVDGQGKIIYRNPDVHLDLEHRNIKLFWPDLCEALEINKFTGFLNSFSNNEKRIVAVTPASPFGWAVAADCSMNAMLQPVIRHVLLEWGVLIFISIFFLAVINHVSKSITTPLKKLQGYAASLGNGQVEQNILISGPIEIQSLTDTFYSMSTNITRREEELKERENLLNNILENIPAMLFLKDAREFRYVRFNRAGQELVGYSQEEMLGKTDYDFFPKDQADFFAQKDKEVISEGKLVEIAQETIQSRNHGERYLHTKKIPIIDKQGNPTFLLGISEDITEQRQIEAALRKSEEKHRILFETMVQGVVYQNADGKIVSANPAAERILGLTLDQMSGLTSMDPSWKTIREDGTPLHGNEHPAMKCLQSGKTIEGFIMGVMNPQKNEPTWISVSAIPLFKNGDTTPNMVYTLFEDITEKRMAEQKYRLLFKEMQNAFALNEIVFDGNGKPIDYRLLEVNPAFEHLTGMKTENIIGKTAREVLPGIENSLIEIYGKVALSGEPVYFEHYSADLNKYLDISAFQVIPNHFANILRDVTERKKNEEEIHRLSQLLIQAQENERYLISCELHDSIAQNLSALKINCDLMRSDACLSVPDLQNKMESTSRLLAGVISDVRNLSYDLRLPGLDEFGLVKALQNYCMDASLKGNTKINFNAVGMSEIKMDGNAEIHLYRLVQEGLSNIRKHAEAGNANIVLLGSYPHIILRIDDDGKGFDMMQQEIMSASYKRMGIRSMRERVNLLNGQMTLQSHPMKGTHIFIKIPIAKKPV